MTIHKVGNKSGKAFRSGLSSGKSIVVTSTDNIIQSQTSKLRRGLGQNVQSTEPVDFTDGLILALYTKNDTGNTIDKTKSRTPFSNKLYNSSSDGYTFDYPSDIKTQNITILVRCNVATNAGGKQYPDIISSAKYDFTLSPFKIFGAWRLALNFDNNTVAFYVHKNNTQLTIGTASVPILLNQTCFLVARINGGDISLCAWDGSFSSATLSDSITYGSDYDKITVGYGESPPFTASSYLNGFINFVYIWNRQVSNADLAKLIFDND